MPAAPDLLLSGRPDAGWPADFVHDRPACGPRFGLTCNAEQSHLAAKTKPCPPHTCRPPPMRMAA